MYQHFNRKLLCINLIAILMMSTSLFAAESIDLSRKPLAFLQSYLNQHKSTTQMDLREKKRSVDFNQTLHIHAQQFVANYPVWGADFIVHIPKQDKHLLTSSLLSVLNTKHGNMNGVIFKHLTADLQTTSHFIFTNAQKEKALAYVLKNFYHNNKQINALQNELLVYVDTDKKAHWAYFITFMEKASKTIPQKPAYIVDANTFQIYKQWNDLHTLENVRGLAEGGNAKTDVIYYDDKAGHYPALKIKRDPITKHCFLRSDQVIVRNLDNDLEEYKIGCNFPMRRHDNLYHIYVKDFVNDSISPAIDTFFAGNVVTNMFKEWYVHSNAEYVWKDINDKPKPLMFWVHENMSNAYAVDDSHIVIGDGDEDIFYSFADLEIIAHEVGHGFTYEHSNLVYYNQSGGLNESFSDMVSKAVEFYMTRLNKWQLGYNILKDPDKALRYMDDPTKDGNSIDHMDDYNDGIGVHYSSGIFNKVFYLIATSPGWDTKKAFNIMVQANMYYWTPTTSFQDAACGLISATKDYAYDTKIVAQSLSVVGLDVNKCPLDIREPE